METSHLYFKATKCNWAKLQNPWQRNTSSNSMLKSVEALPKESKSKVWNLDRLQKPPVFYN